MTSPPISGKLSDNDDSVKDVIHMLSGSGRANSRRRQAARTGEKAGHDQDTDVSATLCDCRKGGEGAFDADFAFQELSKATEDILDEISDCNSTVKVSLSASKRFCLLGGHRYCINILNDECFTEYDISRLVISPFGV